MLDAFDSDNTEDYTKGFPWHPHRGIETITYLVSGKIEHGDNLGNSGVILDGDCQWMTAGSGIIHQEMPKPSKKMLGAQLWLNLPARDKMTAPAYGTIENKNIPVVEEAGTSVRIIAGSYKGTEGAFQGSYIKAAYLDVDIKPGREWTFQSNAKETLLLYILEGEGRFEPDNTDTVTAKQAVLFHPGEVLWAEASAQGMRFLLFQAKPLKEPIAWGGPIVMNTQEELETAFRELEEDTFIK